MMVQFNLIQENLKKIISEKSMIFLIIEKFAKNVNEIHQ